MLEIRGAAPGLIDDPLLLEVSGAAPATRLTWRARIRDDDGFVWRAQGARPEELAWTAAKASAGPVAALRSLRPVDLDVRVEAPDGEASSRTLTRTLLADGVKVRRWRQELSGSLYLPAGEATAAVIVDLRALAEASRAADPPAVAAALLASRGVLVFVVSGGPGDPAALVAALPSAPPRVETVSALPLPPNVPARAPGDPAAWDALLAHLGAAPRRVGR